MHEARVRPGRRSMAASSVAAAVLAWAGVLAAVVVALLQAGASPAQVLAYLAAWVVGSTFPGVMIWRALAGHSTIAKELGFGAVLGIVLQLAVWALATSVHESTLMWLLPAGVAVAFLSVPALRRHWRPERTSATRTPLRWHLSMAVVIALAVYRYARLRGVTRLLPPQASLGNRDTWYNSAISYELSRTLRPRDPFAVHEALRYHWFADAHVTATAQLSGIPIVDAMMTFWLLPMLVVLLLAIAAVAQHFVSWPADSFGGVGRWWVGPLAAFFVFVAPALWRFGRPGTVEATDGFVPSSPSGILAIALILALCGPVLDLLRGGGRRGTWVVLTLLLAGCAGTKPSILPVVAFGAAVVLVLDLFGRRGLNRPMAYALGSSLVLALVAAPILTGSTGGSRLQLLALVTSDPSYARLLGGAPVIPASGGLVVPALADRLPGAVPVIAMLVTISLLTEAPRLLSLLGASARSLRRDPALRWAWGVLVGGYGAMWVLGHPGYSEHWFWTDTVALGTVLTVSNAVRLLPTGRRARTLVLPVAVLAVLGASAGYLTTIGPPAVLSATTAVVAQERLRPYAIVLAALTVAVAVALLLRWVLRRWSLPLLTAVTTFTLAACLPVPVVQLLHARAPDLSRPAAQRKHGYVSPEQLKASLWLQHHSATTSVVATNIFCWPMGQDAPGCWINSMWLGGVSGRRLVLSDWTYSTANLSRYGGVLSLGRAPAPWPERRRLSVEAVQHPSAEVLGRLRREYGARWVFADSRASAISPRLAKLATLRYRSAHIAIYRLRDSYS